MTSQHALIIGAGVAGLQAIATSRRLGAVVSAFDVRPAVKEQVQSLGASFIDTGVTAEGSGGYAREQTGDEQARMQQALAKHEINHADDSLTLLTERAQDVLDDLEAQRHRRGQARRARARGRV